MDSPNVKHPILKLLTSNVSRAYPYPTPEVVALLATVTNNTRV